VPARYRFEYRQGRWLFILVGHQQARFHQKRRQFGDKYDEEDVLGRDAYNMNLLAWFGFEETARRKTERELA
jgi:hypothetical protein